MWLHHSLISSTYLAIPNPKYTTLHRRLDFSIIDAKYMLYIFFLQLKKKKGYYFLHIKLQAP